MLLIAFLILNFVLTSSRKQILDASTSLKENFVGVCQNNMVLFNGTVDAFLNFPIDHDNYVVFRMKDSFDEWAYYQNLPDSYTWAHYNLSVGLQKGRQQAAQWQKPGAIQWTVAQDHPRQNKSNCIRVTESVVKQPGILYKEIRRKVSEFYIIRKKNVMIHETGIIGSQCGYFQFLDACETKFKFIGRKWWNKCKLGLHEANISWASALNGVHSPLLTYKVDSKGNLINWKSSRDDLEENTNGTQFSRYYFSNPILPLQEYNSSGFPSSYNSTTQQFIDHSKESKIPTQSLIESTLAGLCRDKSHPSPLSKPWYPFWQYASHKVLVITAAWDCNYHHFLIDGIARISPFLDYIRAYPELKIHIRRHEIETADVNYRNGGLATRNRIAKLLRIDPNRFISGPYIAEEIITPRSIKCNEAILHPLQMHRLAQLMLQSAEEEMRWRANKMARNSLSESSFVAEFPFMTHQLLNHTNIGNSPKRILIQHRECPLDIIPKEKEDWRCWIKQTFEEAIAAFKKEFPHSEILSLSNKDSGQGNCLECELVIYRDVNLLVGVHGAGMTNMMFMPPGRSLVLEVTGIFDGRMLPVCGYHGPLAAIFGVHHLIHHYDSKGGARVDFMEAANKAKRFFNFLEN